MTPKLMTRYISLPISASFQNTSGVLPVALLLFSLVACGVSTPIASALSKGPTNATAATDSLLQQTKSLLRDATDKGSVDSLQQARALAERATSGSDTEVLAHYYTALASYRIANQLPEDNENRREQVVEDAISHLKRATDTAPEMADAWALLAGCYGQMMGMNPMQGMTLGPKSDDAMEKAKTLAPKNPRVWIISGRQDYYTPSMFGGDKEQALKKFEKAARLAGQEESEDPLMPSWGHAEAYTWIGVAHLNAERYKKAQTAFEKALDLNPDYGWVKQVLLPKVKEKRSY